MHNAKFTYVEYEKGQHQGAQELGRTLSALWQQGQYIYCVADQAQSHSSGS